MDRRKFLRSTLGAGALVFGTKGLYENAALGEGGGKRYFSPVKVSRDRIIRTVVGLRPYRDEGFLIRVERFGEKVVVHNYGHGGAGITLSWGSAAQAIAQVRDTWPRSFAVVGCGVIGLSTARLLQRQGASVTIYARDLPPDTTSNVAGGFWFPTSVYNPQKVSQLFLEQFRIACQTSNRAFQDLVGTDYGVRWIESYILQREAGQERELPGGAGLYPETRVYRDPRRYFGFPRVTHFSTMLIEPATYLNALLRDYFAAGGKLVVKEFRGRAEILALAEPVIINCMGLGAGPLFDDRGLIPVRGQLEVLLPQPEIDYCYLNDSFYMFPRKDGIVLGGTFEHGKWSVAPDPSHADLILNSHAKIMKGLRH